MSLRRRLFWYVVPLVVIAIALAGWFWLIPSNSNALWRIVSQQCLPNQQTHNNPAPCAQVDPQAGFVVFKDRNGPLQYLLMPTAKITGIESPQVLEEHGISVYASIPLSEWQKARDSVKTIKGIKRYKQSQLLAVGNPTDLAIEAIRSLRTSLHFAMMQAQNNVLMMTGVSPSIGKTFVCANLAAVISQTNKRVLLIDCDMRKGYTHELLGTNNVNGLSEILIGQGDITTAAKPTSIAKFDLIPRGQVPPNPSELLMSERFAELVNWASKNYDLVLIDTPPILAVTDAAIVGRHVGTTLMVARYAVNTLKEVETSLSRFEQNGIPVKGVILNSIFRRASAYQDYGYYEYEYKSDAK